MSRKEKWSLLGIALTLLGVVGALGIMVANRNLWLLLIPEALLVVSLVIFVVLRVLFSLEGRGGK